MSVVDTEQPGEQVGVRSVVNLPLLVVAGAFVLTVVLYWSTSVEIAGLWTAGTQRRSAHGWLVLAVSAWLVWRDRAAFGTTPLVPPALGPAVVSAASAIWLVGYNAGLLTLMIHVMPLLVLAVIWSVGGQALARLAAFPVLFLYFALPALEAFSPVLQSITAIVNGALTSAVGIPVVIQGTVITIPEGSFEVGDTCSGLHMMVAGWTIATLHGELERCTLRSRLKLLATVTALALLTNWLRVFAIIIAGHLTNMQHFLVTVDHYYFGWALFAIALVPYFYFSARMLGAPTARPVVMASAGSAPTGRTALAAMLAAAALSSGPAWALVENARAKPLAPRQPPVIDGWSGPGIHLSGWAPVFVNADDEFLVDYASESMGEVALYHAEYRTQRQGKELRGHGNSTVGPGQQVRATRARQLSTPGSSVQAQEEVAVGEDGRQILVWSVFALDGQPGPVRLTGLLRYGVRSIWRAPTASVTVLAAECRPDCEQARTALAALGSEVLPSLLDGADSQGQGN